MHNNAYVGYMLIHYLSVATKDFALKRKPAPLSSRLFTFVFIKIRLLLALLLRFGVALSNLLYVIGYDKGLPVLSPTFYVV